jgi:hypothetical protein
MKAVEFESVLTPEQMLIVPADAATKIPKGKSLRVLILIEDDDDRLQWEQLTALEFGQGYAEGDAIYDQLSVR